MERFTRISKREARKLFNENKSFVLCPVKLRPGSPWSSHCTIPTDTIKDYKVQAAWYAPDGITPSTELWEGTINNTAWTLLYDNWAFYNTSWETGYYAAYYRID
jgi:hypothetical protein